LTTEDIHLVPLANGQFWLGATVEFPADCPTGQPNAQLRENLWHQAIAYYPFLERAEIVNYWSGKRPRPVGESAPVIRPLDGYDNVLLATGHYRNGVLLAPGTAQEVKTWLKAKLA
jgi:glycine/D-amino acid oxidase-like deaminating enzyme